MTVTDNPGPDTVGVSSAAVGAGSVKDYVRQHPSAAVETAGRQVVPRTAAYCRGGRGGAVGSNA
jgi:hypothetical protein